MLAFIVPLKSAQITKSWQMTSHLLERTLRSICAQTSSNYIVIVVCHERPHLSFDHPRLSFVQVSWSIPANEFPSKMNDQIAKLRVGLVRANDENASHVMFVDADDCVSRRLVEFVEAHRDENGYFLNKGYEFRQDRRELKIRNNNFHLRTGTSHIIRTELLKQEISSSANGLDYRESILWHLITASMLKERGTPLIPLPFHGAVLVTDHGENMWWNRIQLAKSVKNESLKKRMLFSAGAIYRYLIMRPLTNSIREEFGLMDIDDIGLNVNSEQPHYTGADRC